ncbi:cell division septation protein DedD [Luteimonas cucumeris]|uniref:Cell division septation protein DedD n=1 Tax=Luteimonas cucumeris TaxID=985012 RepID=A0A562KZZ1_9GAMM|nr:SPOR domain-containing protein [Luteimonas cucumeris]TWI00952.1 cell division septation protein DedD [Luteimonas cucumeris]
MEPALKQRLWGAVILVALSVIFLPMLIQGPAPDSGVADVPLRMPDAPAGQYETRELPLVTPGTAPEGGAVGLDATTPAAANPDAADLAHPAATPGAVAPAVTAPVSQPIALGEDGVSAPAALPAEVVPAPTSVALPAPAAGGDYAVNLGSFNSASNAQGVVRALQQSQLPAYSEPATVNGRSGYRVRIGPYATRADAEAARLRTQQLRSDLRGSVVVLDAEASSRPVAPVATQTAKPAAPSSTSAPTSSTPAPAASGTGFAVQLGAFSKTADANALRDRLRAAGFSAFIEQARTDKGVLSRVRVGPVVSRSDAERLKSQVKAKTGVDGIVRPHP